MLLAHAGYVTAYGAEHKNPVKAAREIAELYDAWGKPDKAEEWRVR